MARHSYGDTLTRRGFQPFLWTQFLGAFNDNLYKQLALLLFVAVPVGPEGKKTDLQVVALLAFSLPFILFSGFAGYLSDRWSKSRIIVGCKIAEVLINRKMIQAKQKAA